IMTTDTFAKGAFATAEIDGETVKIAGICKGSGMIAPDMATMLAFLASDASLEPEVIAKLVRETVAGSFNAVTVHGERSTNDTCLVFGTGKSKAPRIEKASDKRLDDFREKLQAVMHDLAIQLVRDGEGATKLVKVTVSGAKTPASARKICRTICESPLV